MKNTLSLIAKILLVAAVIFLAIKVFAIDGKEIDQLLARLTCTRATVDSLQQVNAKLMTQVDSLNTQFLSRAQEVEALNRRISEQKRKYEKSLRSLYEFKGSDDSLLLELNRAIRTTQSDSSN
jgi:hypothetical protein